MENGLWASLWWAAGRIYSVLQNLLHTRGAFSINGMNARLMTLRSSCDFFVRVWNNFDLLIVICRFRGSGPICEMSKHPPCPRAGELNQLVIVATMTDNLPPSPQVPYRHQRVSPRRAADVDNLQSQPDIRKYPRQSLWENVETDNSSSRTGVST